MRSDFSPYICGITAVPAYPGSSANEVSVCDKVKPCHGWFRDLYALFSPGKIKILSSEVVVCPIVRENELHTRWLVATYPLVDEAAHKDFGG